MPRWWGKLEKVERRKEHVFDGGNSVQKWIGLAGLEWELHSVWVAFNGSLAVFRELPAKGIYLFFFFFNTDARIRFPWELGLLSILHQTFKGTKQKQHYKSIIQGIRAKLQNVLQSNKWLYDRPGRLELHIVWSTAKCERSRALTHQFVHPKEIFLQSDHEHIVYPASWVWNCSKALFLREHFKTLYSRHLCLLSNRAEHGGSVPPPTGCFLSVFQFLIFIEDENWNDHFDPRVFKQERCVLFSFNHKKI